MLIRSGRNAHSYINFVNNRISFVYTSKDEIQHWICSLGKNFFSVGASILLGGLFTLPQSFGELPTGYQTVSGSATFTNDGTTLSINASNRAIINYNTFNIGAINTVNIYSALSLHRVNAGNPSQILGNLNATGKVFLINPSGIIFGQGSRVNVQGLVASTLDIKNEDFVDGRYIFQNNTGILPGTIINHGQIKGTESIAMLSAAIDNTGSVEAPHVAFAVGDKVTYQASPELGISITVDDSLKQKVDQHQAAINNSGIIQGQKVEMQAKLAKAFYETTVNNEGIIKAEGFSTNAAGKIVAVAKTDDGLSTIENSGDLVANGTQDGGQIHWEGDRNVNTGDMSATGDAGQGGNIQLLGNQVEHQSGTIDASGGAGGGMVLIGGDYQGLNSDVRNAEFTSLGVNSVLKADALTTGKGGKIIAWANNSTESHGQISVKGIEEGGFVETSGKKYLNVTSAPDISSLNGKGGTWLLDPNDINIVAGSGNTNINGGSPFLTTNDTSLLGVDLITTALASGNVTISTGTGGANSQNGDITLSTDLNYTGVAGRTLTLNAHRDINLNAPISSTNLMNLSLNADTDANGTGTITSNASGVISLAGGALAMNANSINLGASINTTNGNATLISNTTINSTRPITTGTGVLNVTAPTSVSFNYALNHARMNFGVTNTPSLSVQTNSLATHITLNNGFSGTSLALQAGANGFVFVHGNVNTSGNLDVRSTQGASHIRFYGNVTDNSTTGSSYLAAGASTFSGTTNLTVDGTLSIAGGAAKNLYIYDGNGDIFSKPLFTDGGNLVFNTLALRSGSATDFGSLAAPLPNSTLNLQLQTGGNAYFQNGIGTQTLTTLGTGVSGLLYARAAEFNVGNITAGSLDLATNSSGSINLTQNVTLNGPATFATSGTGAFTISNSRTLATNSNNINISSRTLTLNTSGAINAGTGTVTIKPNIAQALTVGSASKGAALDLTASELSRITAGTLSLGDAALAGGINLDSNLDLSGTGAGRFNLTLNNAGAYTSGANTITLGNKALNINTTDSITSAAVTGTAGSSIQMATNNAVNITGALSADNITLDANGNITLNNGTTLNASGTGNSLVLASRTGYLTNNAGNGALNAANGRWLVYSSNPTDTLEGITTYNKLYNRSYPADLPGSISQSGNHFLYSIAPSLTLTANNASRTYGASNPTLTTTAITGFIDGDTSAVVTGSSALSTTALNSTNVGNYAITTGLGTLANSLGYQFNLVNGNLEVTPASLTVTADNASRTYGQANPSFTASYAGFVLGQDTSVLGGILSLATAATETSAAGDYAITPSGWMSSNYDIINVDGTLTVGAAPSAPVPVNTPPSQAIPYILNANFQTQPIGHYTTLEDLQAFSVPTLSLSDDERPAATPPASNDDDSPSNVDVTYSSDQSGNGDSPDLVELDDEAQSTKLGENNTSSSQGSSSKGKTKAKNAQASPSLIRSLIVTLSQLKRL